ncbi:Endonuclease/exonuclease/phosphatase [Fennellomyces sp. T-0311]|nr:Endonuclease/exonuclease/phosphatase [Fennellomyces sp. T-0311]
MIRNNRLKLCSLNCNSLRKTNNPGARSSLMQFLCQQQPHLLTLQETNAANSDIEKSFHQQLLATSSIWTPHCGLVSFSSDIKLTQIPIDLGDNSQRVIFTSIQSKVASFQEFYVLVIYAPATSSTTVRREFYTQLLATPIFSPNNPQYLDRLIVAGDFNYNCYLQRHRSHAPLTWHTMLQTRFVDCITEVGEPQPLPTFCRGDLYHSTIDFIFASYTLRTFPLQASVQHLSSDWSDHALLSAYVHLGTSPSGKGYWRGNPNYTYYKEFHQQFATHLSTIS